MTTDMTGKEIQTEASRWAERLMDSDVTSAERAEFQRWVLADELHQNEFRVHTLILNLARDLPEQMHAEMPVPITAEQTARRPVWISALAASLALVTGLTAWFTYKHDSAATPHITATAMHRDVTLPDGSAAHLNVRTDLQWLGHPGERRVALLEGETLFEVKHDPTKPFTVVLDASEIRVLGTRFNVRRRDNAEVVVTVLDGTVQVAASSNTRPKWTRTLHANEQLVYNNTGVVRDIYASLNANAAKWREGILEFDDEPLANIVADFSRYTDRRIVIRDSRVAQLRLGGQLDVRNELKASLGLLEKLAPISVKQSGETFILDYRQDVTRERSDPHTGAAL